MKRMMRMIRTAVLFVTTFLLVSGYPFALVVHADSTPPVATPPSQTTTTTAPTSSTPAPVPPKPEPTYTYNSATGRWDSNVWQYDPATDTYVPVPVPQTAPTTTTQIVSPSPVPQVVTPTSGTSTSTTDTTATSTATANNTVNSAATSGNAAVASNQAAGSATSGNAAATATVMNNVNSLVSNSDNQKAASFVSNVMGDVHGDIVLQPMLLKAMLEAGAAPANNTTINSTTNNTLTNNLNLGATSGNANVTSNTQAGNATSGSASTVADVINIINSMVSANKSFVGTINIYGNLNGDILIAPDFIPQLLASNAPAGSGTQVVNSSDTQSIINNVSLAAASGAAAVKGNTSAGNATTGNAQTNVVIFNLSGHQIVAKDSLLVFVNVLGKWVGVIVNAPAGATSAAIGDGVTSNTATPPADLVINANNNTQLINNINLTSRSGDASVFNNTLAGNATTGNATASANIANISGSQIGLSGWFGVLFINVFGNWYGSFGIDTPYGDTPISTDGAIPPRAVEFVPHGSMGTPIRIIPPLTVITSGDNGTYSQVTGAQAAVLAAATTTPATDPATNTLVRGTPSTDFRLPIVIGALVIVGLSLAGFRRFLHG